MVRNDHDTGPNGVTVDDLIAGIFPLVDDLLQRIDGDEFTTNDFIELLRSLPEGEVAYEQALTQWGESPHHARMVIHGQVIPGALRQSTHVEWSGFAYGEDDAFGVPAWWRLKPAGTPPD